ncbi:MAG: hypothetical protein O7J95_19430 [Planctomycetota bacterium]|nr:hypothetical protein [Planctomycetota bacterium]
MHPTRRPLRGAVVLAVVAVFLGWPAGEARGQGAHDSAAILFTIRSVKNGRWSDRDTWKPKRLPRRGDRVLVSRGTDVVYDVESEEAIRLVQVAGSLRFARDRSTSLDVGVLKVQNSEACSESGFACDFRATNRRGEPSERREAPRARLEVGAPGAPIPPEHRARIRLRYLEGFDKDDAPALVCCSGHMEIHGAPLSRTWEKLGRDARAGDREVHLREPVDGWRAGDEVIVTASERGRRVRTFRGRPGSVRTERRRIASISGARIELDRPLEHAHSGSGDYRSEVANLSRNVVIESADPQGVRGHTIYHRFSRGSISYARFAHLGKEGTLGRYSIHFHVVGDSMRGSSVIGAAIVDSHNRWITIHGTNYLVVRDTVGYRSVGHGFFLEDGTEVYNLLDRNLGVHAYRGRRLPDQVMPFDPNDGGAFWWANGRNALVRNVSCENDEYGFRFDSQKRSNFDSHLAVRMPDGKRRTVDIRTLPFYRFEANEAHSEGLYGMALAGTEGAGPDRRHPHVLRGLKIWEVHYGLRPQLPTMLVEDVTIHRAAYGVYRPWFENHVYRNLLISHTHTEPFNRGLDDRSAQHGKITVDGLTFLGVRQSSSMPLIQISANNVSGDAESHFRNVRVLDRLDRGRRALVNLGGGPRLEPTTPKGVPIFIHDFYGPGRHAKVVSTRARDLLSDGSDYRKQPPLTGDESRVAEVRGLRFPELLSPVDDLPPATVVLRVLPAKDGVLLRGVSYDNGEVASVVVNGRPARVVSRNAGVVDWEIRLAVPADRIVIAHATDRAGNVETTGHELRLDGRFDGRSWDEARRRRVRL